MKYLLPMLLMTVFALAGCGKNKSGDTNLTGSWELRKAQTGMSPTVNYAQGNGQRIVFTPTNYTIYDSGTIVKTGSYTITTVDTTGAGYCPYNGPGATGFWIEFDHSTNGRKQINRPDGYTLVLTGGCFALDTGEYREYKKQ